MKYLLYILSTIIVLNGSICSQVQKFNNSYSKFIPYVAVEGRDSLIVNLTQIKDLLMEQPTRWLSVDPMANKYPGWSPYNYCLNNPLRFIDPNGMDVGNYYDENGNYIGTDGYNDYKNYVVPNKNYGIVSEALSNSTILGSEDLGYQIASNNSLLLPNSNVISSMESVVNTATPFNEVGGVIALLKNGGQGVVEAIPGLSGKPSQVNNVSIDVFQAANPNAWANTTDALGTFHTHPSGIEKIGNTTHSFYQPPSSQDIQNARKSSYTLNNYVISNNVFIYNGRGVQATFSINSFFNIGR